ncbi:MAG: hypothetical protein ACREU6_00635 [Steroidobacteraceae bacterium]
MPKIIDTCRALRGHMQAFSKSPMLALNPRGKLAFELTGQLLLEVEDLADRVTLLEIAQASSTEKVQILPEAQPG